MTKTFAIEREFRINTRVFVTKLRFVVTPGSRSVKLFTDTEAGQSVPSHFDIAEARKLWAYYLAQKEGRGQGGFYSRWKQVSV